MSADSAQGGTGERPRLGDHCQIVACRECCCGATAEGPDADPCDHLAGLRGLVEEGHAAVRMSGCLDNCERGNTIVVIPSRLGRAAGGHVTWLGEMLDAATMAALTDWVRQGGPGHADTPTRLIDRLVARVMARRAASSD